MDSIHQHLSPSISRCAGSAWAPFSLLSDVCCEANRHPHARPPESAISARREVPDRSYSGAAIWILLGAVALGGLFDGIPA
jgi:hypothetical protein